MRQQNPRGTAHHGRPPPRRIGADHLIPMHAFLCVGVSSSEACCGPVPHRACPCAPRNFRLGGLIGCVVSDLPCGGPCTPLARDAARGLGGDVRATEVYAVRGQHLYAFEILGIHLPQLSPRHSPRVTSGGTRRALAGLDASYGGRASTL